MKQKQNPRSTIGTLILRRTMYLLRLYISPASRFHFIRLEQGS